MGTSVKGTNRGRVCIVRERVRKEQTGAEFILYGNECERNKQGHSLYCKGTSVKGTNRGRVSIALYCMGTITKGANRGRVCIVLHCLRTSAKGTNRARVCIVWERV